MDRSHKEKLVASLNDTFKQAELVIVTQQGGLMVAQVTDLRRQMRAAGAGFKVAKNRLTKRALEGTRFQGLSGLLKGPTAIAFANKNEKLTIVGGSLGERALDPAGVKALATLPSLDQMRARLVGLLKAPATKIAGVLAAPAGGLARVIAAHARKAEAS